MSASELTQGEWRYISVLVAQDINHDTEAGLPGIARLHHRAWQKIQTECNWEDDNNDDSDSAGRPVQ